MLATWQQRLVREKLDLAEKLVKLEGFLQSADFQQLDFKQQELLHQQLLHMSSYSSVLEERWKLVAPKNV